MMKTDIKISVVIVNYNGYVFLEKCLRSVFAQKNIAFEVILVDNNSSDESILFVET